MRVCSRKKFQKEFAGRKMCAVDRPRIKKKVVGLCGSMGATKIGGVLKKNIKWWMVFRLVLLLVVVL